ncbi:MAG TPA: COX15/CtaA family protein [Candidatus Dormibacteraeota bacterium]
MFVALFRRLAVVTAVFAYLQIALGGVVRVSGSGLGCPDWPLCHGRPYPPADAHAIVEYSHRAVGSVTGVLIIATGVLAWVVWRARRPIVAWLATASLVGVVGEGLLGAEVVRNELASWLVLVHLALAMIILGFLVATAVMAMATSTGVADPGYRRLAAIAVGATYLLLLSGSTVVASGADNACRSWPLCGAGFTPDFAGVNAYTMLHRGAVLVIGALLVFALVRGIRQPGLAAVSIATLVILGLQVAVGAGAAISDSQLFNGLHVALATLVWAGVLTTAVLTLPRTDRAPQLSRLAVEPGFK